MTPELEGILSTDRVGTYLTVANFDRDKALKLYAWNLHLSAAFLPLIACIEVATRNLIGARLAGQFGNHWWMHPEFQALQGSRGKGITLRAAKEISERGNQPSHGRMLAELSFGFWAKMLLQKYEVSL